MITRFTRCLLAAVASIALLATPALAQSLPNLALARLSYTVKKRTVNPQGELKEKIDAVDRELAEATRLGKTGDVRRFLAKGMTLLNGTAWTDVLDFRNSLALRSDHVFVDTSKPYVVRLEQIYSPSIELQHTVTAHVTLRKPSAPAATLAGAGAAPPSGEPVKDLGTFDEGSRDLRESPFEMELDLSTVADGPYQVQVEVLDGTRSLGSASLRIAALKGLDAAASRIETGAKGVPETMRADILYPLDYVRNVNLDREEMRPFSQFDLAKELANSEQVLASAKAGKDPFVGRTGDFKRHYFLEPAKEIMPYRLYVPPAYTAARAFPLVVALHGLGGTEDSMFSAFYKVTTEAEKRGYIVAAPLGYRIDGFYGYTAAGGAGRRTELSAQDVMEVLRLVRQQVMAPRGYRAVIGMRIVPCAGVVHPAPGRQAGARRHANGTGRGGAGEAGAPRRQPVQVRRSHQGMPGAAEKPRVVLVGQDEQQVLWTHIHIRSPGVSAFGRPMHKPFGKPS